MAAEQVLPGGTAVAEFARIQPVSAVAEFARIQPVSAVAEFARIQPVSQEFSPAELLRVQLPSKTHDLLQDAE
jgi:hypothetical protein